MGQQGCSRRHARRSSSGRNAGSTALFERLVVCSESRTRRRRVGFRGFVKPGTAKGEGTMSSRIVKFMKGNAIAMIALFIALGGTASAATLAVNSVGSKQLKKNAVTTAKIKNNAVTTPKIKDTAVTGAKIAAGAVANANIAAGAVTGDKVNVATLPKVPAAANADNANTLGGVSNAVWGKSVKIVGIGF